MTPPKETPRKQCRMGLIRALLKRHPDGLTSAAIANLLDIPERNRCNLPTTIKNMPDVYIDRWEITETTHPVYMLADIPEDMPRPPPQPKIKENPKWRRLDQDQLDIIYKHMHGKKLNQTQIARIVGCKASTVKPAYLREIARRAK